MPMCPLLWNNLFCFPMELLFSQDLKDGEQNQEYQVLYVKAWIIYYFIVVLLFYGLEWWLAGSRFVGIRTVKLGSCLIISYLED